MLLTSNLATIFWREFTAGEPYWWPWAHAIRLATLLALSLVSETLDTLRRFISSYSSCSAPISVEEGILITLWEDRGLKSVKTIGRRSRQVQKPVLAQEWTDNYKGRLPEAYKKLSNCVGIAWNHKHLRKRKRSSSPIGLGDYYFMKEKHLQNRPPFDHTMFA